MATPEQIIEKLQDLDPDNDEHWTQDGAPRMAVIEESLGNEVTREQINEAAPQFSRENFVLPESNLPDEEEEEEEEQSQENVEDLESQRSNLVQEREQKRAEAQRLLSEANLLSTKESEITAKINSLSPPVSRMSAVRNLFQSDDKRNEEQATRIKNALGDIKPAELKKVLGG